MDLNLGKVKNLFKELRAAFKKIGLGKCLDELIGTKGESNTLC